MARSRNNNATHGLSGRVDRLVFKTYDYGIVVSKVPNMDNVQWSEGQLGTHSDFSNASAYAKAKLKEPGMEAYYKSIAKPGCSAYNMAVKEYYDKRREGGIIRNKE
jgi:hypothetical protein